MNTMYRCALSAFVAFAALGISAQASAQGRTFPQNTLRGSMVFGDYPSVTLNGHAAELSPGSRVRNQDNMIVQAATLTGPKWLVHYTMDMGGAQVRDVWILRPEEAAIKPWPATPEQAQTWVFDNETQTWTKP
jgi:hypothetical protein